MDDALIHPAILGKIEELARSVGAHSLPHQVGIDDSIPDAGTLDSASVLELIIWLEAEFDVQVQPEAMTVENLGTVRRMVEFVRNRRG